MALLRSTSVNVISYIIDKNGSFIRKKFATRSNYYHEKRSILFSWDTTFNHPCREELGRMLEYINQFWKGLPSPSRKCRTWTLSRPVGRSFNCINQNQMKMNFSILFLGKKKEIKIHCLFFFLISAIHKSFYFQFVLFSALFANPQYKDIWMIRWVMARPTSTD
jgi:hypothetical protein